MSDGSMLTASLRYGGIPPELSGRYELVPSPAARAGVGTIVSAPVTPDFQLHELEDAIHEGAEQAVARNQARRRMVDSYLRLGQNSSGSPRNGGGPVYGKGDIYSSPASKFGALADLDEIDEFLELDDEDDEDEEFGAILGIGKGGGVLGIALTTKARKKKVARILGKLKKFYEQGKLDKAQRYAKALRGPVKRLEKKGELDSFPELEAWLQFAEDGDVSALEEALGQTDWTGDEEIESDEPGPAGDYSMFTSDGGVRGGGAGGGRRRLPPGYRPPRYVSWVPRRKEQWLMRHPVAASVRHPADPPGWRRPGRVPPRGRPLPPSGTRRGFLARHPRVRQAVRNRRQRRAARYGEGIGAEAFEPMSGRSTFAREELFVDDSYGALFRRDLETRIDAAQKKYERLRRSASSDKDWERVQRAFQDYKNLVANYRRGATAPTLKPRERVLAEMQEQPLFPYSSSSPKPLGEDATWDAWLESHSMPGMDDDDDDDDLDDEDIADI